MLEFKVNDYITLKLKNGKTVIYIKKKPFINCKRLVLQIPINMISKFDEIGSIDEAADVYKKTIMDGITYEGFHGTNPLEIQVNVSDKEEFWGHCSNLQVWVENDYNTRILHSNLAFPLLRKLTEVGDPLARKVFKDEIAERFSSGNLSVMRFLLEEDYLSILTKDELNILFESIDFKIITKLENEEAFPLLKKLTEAGSSIAKNVSKDKITKIVQTNNLKLIKYLIKENYINWYFKKEDLNSLIEKMDLNLIAEKDFIDGYPLLSKIEYFKFVKEDIIRRMKTNDFKGLAHLYHKNFYIFTRFSKEEFNSLIERMDLTKLNKFDSIIDFKLLLKFSFHNSKVKDFQNKKIIEALKGNNITIIKYILKDWSFYSDNFDENERKSLYDLNGPLNIAEKKIKEIIVSIAEGSPYGLHKWDFQRYRAFLSQKRFENLFKDIDHEIPSSRLKQLAEIGDPIAQSFFKEKLAKKVSQDLNKMKNDQDSLIKYLLTEEEFSYFNDQELAALFSELDFSIIKKLDFSDQALFNYRGERGFKLPESLGLFTSLESLNLRDNRIYKLPKAIGNLTSLRHLNLSRNSLSGRLPATMGNLKSLQTLDLTDNQGLIFPKSMGNLDSLEDLYYRQEIYRGVPESISNLKKLKNLHIDGFDVMKIPRTLGEMTWLRLLDLSNSNLESIPKSIINNLKNLEELYIQKNELISLPKSIVNLTSLKKLCAKQNKIEKIPSLILKLNSLKIIDVSFNPITSMPKKLLEKSLKGEITLLFTYYCKKCLKKHVRGKIYEEHLSYASIQYF